MVSFNGINNLGIGKHSPSFTSNRISPYGYNTEPQYDEFVNTHESEGDNLKHIGFLALLGATVAVGMAFILGFKGNSKAGDKIVKPAFGKDATELGEEVGKTGFFGRISNWRSKRAEIKEAKTAAKAEAKAEKANKPGLLKRLFGRSNKTAKITKEAPVETLDQIEEASDKAKLNQEREKLLGTFNAKKEADAASGAAKPAEEAKAIETIKIETLPDGTEVHKILNDNGTTKMEITKQNGAITKRIEYSYQYQDGKAIQVERKTFDQNGKCTVEIDKL